ncbi:hypothetical protein HanIR_Chr16g0834581 [Helianthus annuus]|nr:hypothetical protein HanIR_Chr16g0834581 [Helianthus annuus]
MEMEWGFRERKWWYIFRERERESRCGGCEVVLSFVLMTGLAFVVKYADTVHTYIDTRVCVCMYVCRCRKRTKDVRSEAPFKAYFSEKTKSASSSTLHTQGKMNNSKNK